jgi:hypothetical protein
MEQIDLMKKVMEQKLIQDLLAAVPEDQKPDAMKLIEDVTKGVQEKFSAALPALQAMPATQLEKILRDQAK